MQFQYYWDHGFWPPEGHGSDITERGSIVNTAIDRIKAKAEQAKGVVPRLVASVESGLDEIIWAEGDVEKLKAEALAPHLAAIAETRTQLEGIGSALDTMSNGGPPLQGSTAVLPSSGIAVVHPVDHGTGDPIKT